ncbi:class IIb bacteriocin, lactobin A/cerein 7B family [Streptococcus plurextorum]|nr:class IIb bacteriocin, lactobin A/cerein 7B family [Streptococcus plurextorum]
MKNVKVNDKTLTVAELIEVRGGIAPIVAVLIAGGASLLISSCSRKK